MINGIQVYIDDERLLTGTRSLEVTDDPTGFIETILTVQGCEVPVTPDSKVEVTLFGKPVTVINTVEYSLEFRGAYFSFTAMCRFDWENEE